MNYDLQYDQLIFKAKLRELYYPLTGYTEKHHIIPRCIDPVIADLRKHPENKAILTPEEHYDAHVLLVQMDRYKEHPKYPGLALTVVMMTGGKNKISKELYGELRRVLAADQIGKKLPQGSVEKRSATLRKNHQKVGFIHPLKGKPSPSKGIKRGRRKGVHWNTGKKRLPGSIKKLKETMRIKNKTINLLSAFKQCKKKICYPKNRKQTQFTKDKITKSLEGRKQSDALVQQRITAMLTTIHSPDYINPKTGKTSSLKGIKTSRSPSNKGKHKTVLANGKIKFI